LKKRASLKEKKVFQILSGTKFINPPLLITKFYAYDLSFYSMH